ncbi:MAG: EAL domain-containing protein [Lachnospiraceae bacterium]|nr:EAL domain-containing protein [Lachnospiraceae bacterium]
MKQERILGRVRAIIIGVSIICLISAVFLIIRIFNNSLAEKEISVEAPAEVSHRVLFLCSYTPLYFTYDSQVAGIEEVLYPNGIEYDVVFMDAKNFSTVLDRQIFYEYMKAHMTDRRQYEAMLVGDDDALQFALQYQNDLFSGIPIVFFGINDQALAQRADGTPLVTGFYETDYFYDTLETAMALFPDSRTIVGLHDLSAAGAADAKTFYDFAGNYPSYTFTDINTSLMTLTELKRALNNIPEDGILFYMTCYSDISGNTYSLLDRTHTVVNEANVPIFRNYEGAENTGVIGGSYLDFTEQCRQAAQRVVDILEGRRDVEDMPLEMHSPGKSAYDYNMLTKYQLDLSLIPEGAEIYNRPESFIEYYGEILPPVVLIGIALVLLVFSAQISLSRARRISEELKKSQESLAKSHEEMTYRAEHDDLMGILNRRAAGEHLRADLKPEDTYSILMADIDGFKGVNESYGHKATDDVLRFIANLLKEAAEKHGWFLARYGGDEFLFMVPDRHVEVGDDIVEELLKIFSTTIPVGVGEISMAASLGISNSDGVTTTDQHILNAENAMYEAKSRGGNGAFLFADEMKAKLREESVIKEKLLEAFENDGFFMLYQPQIDSQTLKVSGYEALVRMKEPGMYPGKFIPVAEENGWIWRIGRITTELVIKQLAAWRDEGKELHPVSINFSSNQINDIGYVNFVEELLEKYDISTKYIEIELTEGLFLDQTTQSANLFNRFKEMGIRLLMDDFGTGYSSFGYLTYIPVDVIKLDKSLVDNYLVDGKDQFIRDIIQLMHGLDKEMIIEGVEEDWQFKRLREFKADTIQGYFFSKPIPADEAIDFTVKEEV